ncbi:endonuclease/exonuclease/phosphatase family protein [Chelativorans salis]|uniref:Endonuclease/exonuclease/phosphatase family protein n=1 Tax=Chelativorans salis TaxID=2978478 RepID=A0ABT2LHG4_9HYPH|nr:endonuclease/exonuclease/phosphatase family protein [Chelativorans sp. EGI FJ00035]MCT7374002.1 endonuclease/exonuclease/phosphatase family protein [Chelativorans sp. EGI FJ00035]
MKSILFASGCLLIVMTLLSFVKSAKWWIRGADFPRLQIAVASALVLCVYLFLYEERGTWDAIFLITLAGALGYQSFRIFPYTIVAPREVAKASGDADTANSIRLLIANVLMENRAARRFLALVQETRPDIILAVETDAWWDEQLRDLSGDYPHSIKQPQENHYGMHLFSKLELASPEVRFLVEGDVPSVRASVRLRSGQWIEFFGVHPRPPEPRTDTEERDAEILIVGRQVKAQNRPAIVAGDLNDVAWSHTTRLFQRTSGLLDPRRGRGMFSTFHARYPLFRWPLDHIFHDASYTLVHLQRLRGFGSDHFPVLAELHYTPSAAEGQEAPESDQDDRAEAQEKIAEGKAAD